MIGIEQAFAASDGAVAAGAIAGGLMTIGLISIVFWILLIVARWKIFTKAGEAGWKSIIPVYSDYVQWRIAWNKTGLFWAMLALAILGSVLLSMSGSYVVEANGAVVATGGGNSILLIIGFVAILAAAILELIATYKLMEAFGHGFGWLILFIIIPSIMLLVLGFGSSRYLGPSE